MRKNMSNPNKTKKINLKFNLKPIVASLLILAASSQIGCSTLENTRNQSRAHSCDSFLDEPCDNW